MAFKHKLILNWHLPMVDFEFRLIIREHLPILTHKITRLFTYDANTK